jgi:hypothetical protein
MSSPTSLKIAVRSYAVQIQNYTHKRKRKTSSASGKKRKGLPRPSDTTLVFDTETTTDHTQRLRFGTYRVYKKTKFMENGIFYEPENVTPDELQLLRTYTEKNDLVLRTREEFVRKIFYIYGYHHDGLILGFNLPFDLSRLATKASTSCASDMRGGFSLQLLPEKWLPNLLVKHLNSRSAFMRFASNERTLDSRSARKKRVKTETNYGYLQDVKTLAAALLGRSFSLGALADFLETERRKMGTDEHGGPLTPEYLDYAINDTLVTWECYVELKKKYEEHGLSETPPHRIYSEASLGKAYLRQMNLRPWTKAQKNFPPDIIGTIMSTYYGGRSEVCIRREITRILYCDFRSMYPTVCTLMGLWRYVIATGLKTDDWTKETCKLLDKVGLSDIRNPRFWRKLNVLIQVEPDDDILPVRAPYLVPGRRTEPSRTIGLNYLTAEFSNWYTLADCIASKVLTGRSPKVIRAIRFKPRGKQRGFKPIAIGGNDEYRIDPTTDDFYKRVIELRGEVQSAVARARAEGANAERGAPGIVSTDAQTACQLDQLRHLCRTQCAVL